MQFLFKMADRVGLLSLRSISLALISLCLPPYSVWLSLVVKPTHPVGSNPATKQKTRRFTPRFLMADRVGFEPTVPFGGTHDFQSCTFGLSVICPRHRFYNLFLCLASIIFYFYQKRNTLTFRISNNLIHNHKLISI